MSILTLVSLVVATVELAMEIHIMSVGLVILDISFTFGCVLHHAHLVTLLIILQ